MEPLANSYGNAHKKKKRPTIKLKWTARAVGIFPGLPPQQGSFGLYRAAGGHRGAAGPGHRLDRRGRVVGIRNGHLDARLGLGRICRRREAVR